MSTRLTTGLLSCLMASFFVGCAASPESLIRGQSPSAYPMPAGAYSGHGFGAYSQGVPFPYNGLAGQALQAHVRGRADAYYGTRGSSGFAAGGFHGGGYPVSTSYPVAYGGGGDYQTAACDNGATCENGYCEDPYCNRGYCHHGYRFGDCLHGCRSCPYCNGHGCDHCNGGQWAPTHLYQHMYKIPQGMVYPQNPTPGAITVYPYYTHKGPDDFFYPPLKK